MPKYRLHYFPESGNSYKLALMLTLCGESFEGVWTDFAGGATRTAEWRRDVNPMGEIPVLEIDGKRFTQTAPILLKLSEQYGRFGGETEDEKFELLRWLFWDNHKLSGQAGPCRFLLNFLPPEKRPEGVAPFLQGRLRAAYAVLDQHLAGRDWIVGDGPTIADFSCCGYLYYPEPFGFERADWPHLDRWLGRIAALPGWAHPYDMMPGKPSDRA